VRLSIEGLKVDREEWFVQFGNIIEPEMIILETPKTFNPWFQYLPPIESNVIPIARGRELKEMRSFVEADSLIHTRPISTLEDED
jgi:hypothetical protein